MPDDLDDLDHIARLAREERAELAALARAEGISPEDAVDCVQEGLCTLLTYSRRDRSADDPRAPRSQWGALLASMVRNAARNRRRRHHVAKPHAELESLGIPDPDVRATDDTLADAEAHVRLRACVNELCDTQRAVVTLRMLEERPGEDVARALGIQTGHVAVLLHRAKNQLRACMAS